MKIIISPAKKMNMDTDTYSVAELPVFLEEAEILMRELQKLSFQEAKTLWNCNDKLAELNYDRFRVMDLRRSLTPAVLAYEGLQYQHMAPEVFTEKALTYIGEHLRILSGFYGILRPFDGVTPYRLEMQARFSVNGTKNLYEFWGCHLYRELTREDHVILNLASREYAKAVEPYCTPEDRFITAEFGEWKDGKVRQKGTFAKMARGEMVRYLAENQISDPEGVKVFRELGLVFCEELSSPSHYVFVRTEGRKPR